MLDSILVYFGLLITVTGLVSLVRSMRFLRIRTRSRATITAMIGLLLAIVSLLLPVRTKQVSTPTTRLDEWMPIWQFDQRHTIHVDTTPEKAFAAVHAVRADEILFFRTLIAIRRCGRPGPERLITAPEKKPLLQVATETTFASLADDPPRELVIGTVVAAPPGKRPSGQPNPALFHQTLPPGFALATV